MAVFAAIAFARPAILSFKLPSQDSPESSQTIESGTPISIHKYIFDQFDEAERVAQHLRNEEDRYESSLRLADDIRNELVSKDNVAEVVQEHLVLLAEGRMRGEILPPETSDTQMLGKRFRSNYFKHEVEKLRKLMLTGMLDQSTCDYVIEWLPRYLATAESHAFSMSEESIEIFGEFLSAKEIRRTELAVRQVGYPPSNVKSLVSRPYLPLGHSPVTASK